MKIKVFVLATNANGSPEIVPHEVEVDQDAYDEGEHYDLAKEHAEELGYETPMIAFDENDVAANQFKELAELMEAPAS